MKHLVVLLLVLPGVLCSGELLRLEDSADAMGTAYTVVLYGEDQEKLMAAAEAAFEEVRRLDRTLSNYRPNSEWSQVNRRAADEPVPVSPELFGLLSACVEYSRLSEGTFDISVGPLMRMWGFFKGSGRLPSKEEVAGAMASVGYQNILLDASSRTVRFRRPGVELDPGGIGKGYAVDRMAEILKDHGVKSALISAGGSSIYAIGAPPDDPGWKVRIRHPREWSQSVEEFHLKDESLSTSGDYEKFFEAGGGLYSHIMDPRTGYPATGTLSVSVVAPSTLDSEAWTKPLLSPGRGWAAKNKPKGLRVFFCEDKTELACAWLQ